MRIITAMFTDPANPSTNKYVVEVLNDHEKPIARVESPVSIEDAASRALREMQRMHDAAEAMMHRGGAPGAQRSRCVTSGGSLVGCFFGPTGRGFDACVG